MLSTVHLYHFAIPLPSLVFYLLLLPLPFFRLFSFLLFHPSSLSYLVISPLSISSISLCHFSSFLDTLCSSNEARNMSRPTFFHPKGPSVQVATSPSLGHLDHKTTATTAFESPSSYSSPSSSFASTPMASTTESPATVCSDNLYQVASRSSHIVSSSGGGSQQGPFVEFIRAHPKGAVRFRPFEEGLDDVTRRYIEEFQIYPFGSIEEFCRHIPYASGKKDFFEKTGRESFEGMSSQYS